MNSREWLCRRFLLDFYIEMHFWRIFKRFHSGKFTPFSGKFTLLSGKFILFFFMKNFPNNFREGLHDETLHSPVTGDNSSAELNYAAAYSNVSKNCGSECLQSRLNFGSLQAIRRHAVRDHDASCTKHDFGC